MADHEFTTGLPSSRITDMIDKIFDHWTVIGYAGSQRIGTQSKTFWWCMCRCGTVKKILAGNLRRHLSKSCGCLKHKHGISPMLRSAHQSEYRIFHSMWNRCTNPNNRSYINYGARGIYVCKEWYIFDVFLKDMGPRPSPIYSIERKDNNGPYNKDNCIWATRKVQNSNTRRNHFITFNNITRTLAEWSRIYDRQHTTVLARLKLGWTIEQALTLPLAKRGNRGQRPE
jgi:hypothetical protein